MDENDRRTAGMKMRRRILGDAHVDRALAQASDHSAEFQDLITRYAWGEVWTRPGLDARTRRLIVLATTIALGRWEEFRLHAQAALSAGDPAAGDSRVSAEDIKEVALQQAVYCGVPAANTAFEILRELTSA